MFDYPQELKQTLSSALKAKGTDYQARTRYLDEHKQAVYTNRLILEDSPYLLQHAHNPVDWYPWGEEAFAKARQENKPVFLSIGYSTCHWCHVMEEESFDNEDVAQVMNDLFVCIKVDRELHPDVDTFYMTAVMMMQGQGGWPMSSFLTHERKPFFGGTYFPPTQFIALMQRVNEVWHKQTDDIQQQADAISQNVSNAMAARQSLNEIGTNVIEIAAQSIMNHHDPRFGGFGQAPKFPNEPYLYFLLEYAIYSADTSILNAVTSTLHIQSCGGIYDQIGGGFHRYATDRNWLVPHFEKMLYNQANLSYVFTQAYQLTGNKDFKRIACETLDYVMREMTNEKGGIYSATDADSEGEEGLFFIWEKQQIESLLNEADAKQFIDLYQISEAGNFEGKNIPHLEQAIAAFSEKNKLDYDELIKQLNSSKKILWQEREKRIPPLRDDKVITAWNGMMIKSFAYVGQQLERQDYIEHAINAANYVLNNNKTDTDALSRSSLDGKASIPALQEDYAYLAEALLQLFDATLKKKWLEKVVELVDQMIDLFWDETHGGFYMGSTEGDSLLPAMPKEIQDNATASGNSVALRVLVRLAVRVSDNKYALYAEQQVHAFSDDITQRPYICSYLMCGLLEMHIGEQSSQQWCANGNVHIVADKKKIDKHYKITLNITMNENWHLNQIANDENEIPVTIDSQDDWQLSNITYPESVSKKLGFQDEAVNVYENNISVSFDVSKEKMDQILFPDNILKLKLGIQACDDQKCLAPENVNIVVYL